MFSFISAWLIFTESGGRTSSGRATTGSITRIYARCGGTSLSFSFSHFSFSSIGAANIHRITWANIKQAGDDGDQSEELMRNSEEDHFRGGTSLSSHFVFSSTDAANIHRITWVNIVRAGGRRDQ